MIYVCPEKDSVCGDLSSNWCGACPMWQKRQRLGSAACRPMPGLAQPTPPQAPEEVVPCAGCSDAAQCKAYEHGVRAGKRAALATQSEAAKEGGVVIHIT